MKIVYVGAGSHDFGRGQIVDLMSNADLRDRELTVSLVDLNERALDTMVRFAEMAKRHFGARCTVQSSTDRRAALPGADYVITSVARKRYELWEQDFRVPLAYGFVHPLGENGGPGALFHALRSFELIMPICRDVEALCPQARLFNFTNPEARVLHAISTLTEVKAYGICHGVFSALHEIERLVGRPWQELDIVSAGMNHFYRILKAVDRKTGRDLLPEIREKALRDQTLSARSPLFAKLLEHFDMFTYASDDHIGEYLSYGAEFSGTKWHYGREATPVRVAEEPPRPGLEDYVSARVPMDEGLMRPSGETTVSMIADIESGRSGWYPAVNVLNTELFIENLAPGGVVEVPAAVDGKGVHPQKVGPMPEPTAAIIRQHHTIHALLTEAYRTRSKKLLLQALLLDPCVNSIVRAERMLEDMLELQRDFLPSFA